jgi:hypothetical protein
MLLEQSQTYNLEHMFSFLLDRFLGVNCWVLIMVSLGLTFSATANLLSKVALSFCILTSDVCRCQCLHILTHTGYYQSFCLQPSYGVCSGPAHCGFVDTSLLNTNASIFSWVTHRQHLFLPEMSLQVFYLLFKLHRFVL